MFSTKNACVSRVLPWRRRVMKWVYLWLLLVGCMLIPREAACAHDERGDSFPTGTRGSAEDSAPPQSPEDSAPSNATADGLLWEENLPASEVYSHLVSLRDAFIRTQVGSANGVPPYEDTIIEGRDLVAMHIPLAIRSCLEEYRRVCEYNETEQDPKHHGIILDGQPVIMVSAATGRTGQYTFMRKGFRWNLVLPDGQRYSFKITPLESDMTLHSFRAVDLLRTTKATTELPAVFGLQSLSDVEGKFGLLVTHDLLTHPSMQPHISFPDGSTLNFILIGRSTAVTLSTFAARMESNSSSCPAIKKRAQIARYNLTLQLILLIGRITRHGVTLERFDASQIHLDELGNAFFMPFEEPRREEWHDSSGAEYTAGWSSHDRLTNAMDLGRVLLYLWCPAEASEVSIYETSPRVRDVLAVVKQCRSIPEEVRHIIWLIFNNNISADSLLRSDIFQKVHLRLRQLVEELDARA